MYHCTVLKHTCHMHTYLFLFALFSENSWAICLRGDMLSSYQRVTESPFNVFAICVRKSTTLVNLENLPAFDGNLIMCVSHISSFAKTLMPTELEYQTKYCSIIFFTDCFKTSMSLFFKSRLHIFYLCR